MPPFFLLALLARGISEAGGWVAGELTKRRHWRRRVLVAVAVAAGLPWLPVAGATQTPRTARLSPAITFYGRPGTFGDVTHDPAITTRPVPGWAFDTGQAGYFATVAKGQVLIANEPQTDNQLEPTARDMAVSTFDPTSDTFRNVALPGAGPADVSDLVATGDAVAFISSRPGSAHPALGWLTDSSGSWTVDGAASKSASQVARSSAEGRTACGPADCRGLAEVARLPGSGDLVATQYFDDPANNRFSGGLLVLTPAGDVVSYYAYPNISGPDGTALSVHPREVDVDPTSQAGNDRFVVVFDVFAHDGAAPSTGTPFTMQQFSLDGTHIRPTSAAITSGYLGPLGRAGFETAMFDRSGNLWAAQSYQGSLSSAPLVQYRGGLARCQGTGWAVTCPADLEVPEAAPLGQARSLNEDPATGAVLETTMSGFVLPVVDGRARPAIDLGLGRLVDRSRYWIGPRKGAVDPTTRRLWLPIQQLQSPAVCAQSPCTGLSLDQWLVSVDLAQVFR